MSEELKFVLAISVLPLCWLIWLAYYYLQRYNRAESFQKLAIQHGFTYHKVSNSLNKYLPLGLQKRIPNNDGQTYRHIMQGHWGKMPVVIFDMLHGTSSKHETSIEQTAIAFHIALANMPMYKFTWRSGTLADAVKYMVGYKFVKAPELNMRGDVLLSFDDQPQKTAAVLKHLPPTIYKTLLESGVSITCDGEWLIYFRSGRLVRAESAALEQFMAEGRALVTAALSKAADDDTPLVEKSADPTKFSDE